jgi:nucleotide-binding universal stress UspA family protein
MFTRILVPTDLSAPSDAALAYARGFAGTFDAALHLLHVADNRFLRAVVGDPHDQETAALRQLQERLTDEDRRRFRALPVVEHSDEPADEVVSYARTRGVDLIVMGTHGRSGMAHLLLGSVAEKVVRSAPCPVLTVREAPRSAGKAQAGPTRILVPTDFSAPSDAALDSARLLAARFGASLHLLHVVDEVFANGAFGLEGYAPESHDARTARFDEASRRLAAKLTPYDRTTLQGRTGVIFGTGARPIVDYAADNAFDLIVMGTHGRTGVAHLVMGSIAETVVRSAPCPVMTVREAREAVREPVVDAGAVTAHA